MSAVTTYLLDTNIISHMMRYPQGLAAQRVFQFATQGAIVQLCTSVVVDCELRFGLQRRSNPQWSLRFEAAMASLEICPLTPEVSAFYAKLKYSTDETCPSKEDGDATYCILSKRLQLSAAPAAAPLQALAQARS